MVNKIIIPLMFIFSCRSPIKNVVYEPPLNSFELQLSRASHSRDKEIDSLNILIIGCVREEKDLFGQLRFNVLEKKFKYQFQVTDLLIAEFDSIQKVK